MKAFEFATGRTEEEVLSLLSPQVGHTEILAGGTDLVGLMKKMIITPERVVNILEVDSMQQIERQDDGSLKIGAVVKLDDLLASSLINNYAGVVDAIRGINSMQLQAQGTIGGEICQRPRCWFFRNGHGLLAGGGQEVVDGDHRFHAVFGNQGPAKFVSSTRLAPALIALGAEVRIVGPAPGQEQMLPLTSLYRTPRHEQQREIVLQPNQLLTHIVLPPAGGRVSATYEVRQSEGPDYPLAAAAASLQILGGIVREACIVLGQAAPTPWVSPEAAGALIGQPVTAERAEAAAAAAVALATPLAGNQYKVDLAQVAVKRAILKAAGLPTGGFC